MDIKTRISFDDIFESSTPRSISIKDFQNSLVNNSLKSRNSIDSCSSISVSSLPLQKQDEVKESIQSDSEQIQKILPSQKQGYDPEVEVSQQFKKFKKFKYFQESNDLFFKYKQGDMNQKANSLSRLTYSQMLQRIKMKQDNSNKLYNSLGIPPSYSPSQKYQRTKHFSFIEHKKKENTSRSLELNQNQIINNSFPSRSTFSNAFSTLNEQSYAPLSHQEKIFQKKFLQPVFLNDQNDKLMNTSSTISSEFIFTARTEPEEATYDVKMSTENNRKCFLNLQKRVSTGEIDKRGRKLSYKYKDQQIHYLIQEYSEEKQKKNKQPAYQSFCRGKVNSCLLNLNKTCLLEQQEIKQLENRVNDVSSNMKNKILIYQDIFRIMKHEDLSAKDMASLINMERNQLQEYVGNHHLQKDSYQEYQSSKIPYSDLKNHMKVIQKQLLLDCSKIQKARIVRKKENDKKIIQDALIMNKLLKRNQRFNLQDKQMESY